MGDITYLEYPDPLVWWQLAPALVGMLAGGFAIGSVGLGGVIWVPILLLLPGIEAPLAVGTVFVGSVPAALYNTLRWFLKGHINMRDGGALAVGGTTGSFVGAIVLKYFPSAVLSLMIAAVCLYSGIEHLYKRRRARAEAKKASPPKDGEAPCNLPKAESKPPPAEMQSHKTPEEPTSKEPTPEEPTSVSDVRPTVGPELKVDTTVEDVTVPAEKEGAKNADKADAKVVDTEEGKKDVEAAGATKESAERPGSVFPGWRGFLSLSLIGLIIGFASSLSGTGGPLLVFPTLFYLRPGLPMHQVIGMSKPFTLTLVTAAAVGALIFGEVDLGLAGICGLCFITGIELGTRLAFHVSAPKLRLATAIALIIVGLLVSCRAVMKMTGN
eukprot:Hpha_TRINITY_DN15957_c1_g2::TRINITY_DN15957_c1_g2_i1::g.73190::m.73190